MRQSRSFLLILMLVSLLSFGISGGDLTRRAHAQPGSQTLRPGIPVSGTLDADDMTDDWFFDAEQGDIISLVARTTAGDLDPVLGLSSPGGEKIAANDNETFDSLNARLEGVLLSSSGRYRVEVYREGLEYGSTAGDYELTLYEGFSQPAPLELGPQRLELEDDSRLVTESIATLPVLDFHLAVQATLPDSGRAYDVEWQFHQSPENDVAWTFRFDSEGNWLIGLGTTLGQMEVQQEGQSPDIVPGPGETADFVFQQARGHFSVFIDRQLLAMFETPADLMPAETGELVIALRGTLLGEIRDTLILSIDDVAYSAAFYSEDPVLAGAVEPSPPGTRLYDYNGIPIEIVRELRALNLIPAGGGIQAQVSQSFLFTEDTGFTAYPLFGFPQDYQNVVIGFDAIIQRGPADSACGIIFRQEDAANFATALFTPSNFLYFLQYAEGEALPGGLVTRSGALQSGLLSRNRFVILAQDGMGELFVNGRYIGEIELAPVSGDFAIHLVLQTPELSYCSLDDVWIWSLDDLNE